MSIWTPEDKKRISEIATQLVVGQAKAGKLNLDDQEAVKVALKQAVRDATSAYSAALAYISG